MDRAILVYTDSGSGSTTVLRTFAGQLLHHGSHPGPRRRADAVSAADAL
ncbi:hypothetical protein [Streptomyces bullii]|uniref:Uncharacterized protein n=1 Tax=Streptomyces bullii TaxID=349910 RepID=A0ABW0V1L4_9ACTN